MKPKTLHEAYERLSETKKAILRVNFLGLAPETRFETFHKKLNNELPMDPDEKKWFAEKLKLPEMELFPEPKAKTESNEQ